MNEIIVTEEFIKEIAEGEADFCRRVRKCDPLEAVKNLVSGYGYQLTWLENYFGTEAIKAAHILEIGSGNGFFLCHAIKSGLNIKGVEPGKRFGFEGRFTRATRLLELNGIHDPEKYLFDATAEDIPFDDNSFDLVFSVTVLEHVRNVEQAMKESIRVLKPGKMLLAHIPNYNSFSEGHYNIPWLPYMNKSLAKLYVQHLFKRDPYFIDELNFTTPGIFKKYENSIDTCGKMRLSGSDRRLFNIISGVNEMLRKKEFRILTNKRFLLKKIFLKIASINFLRLLLIQVLTITAEVLTSLRFAPTFDLVLYKKK